MSTAAIVGFSLVEEISLIKAAVDEAAAARIAVLLLPGVGTVDDLREARQAGASVARIGVDVDGVLAAAEEVVRPLVPKLPWMDRSSVVQGYAGVYSSFLLHAQRAAERYGVPAHAILQRVGEAGYVGGQEDMIIDIALQLQAAGNRQGAS